ncbi:hypothetical protein M9H77_26026 [Catharanthus roseus]|uniref:Uncharacterized protein n=1 Tax=Catharanthus roseus TaxID=4058 RepID=A0ACC0ACS2_CATRO|nr:hypothetical protein M9H77_26026 [Catharanthus roseus]
MTSDGGDRPQLAAQQQASKFHFPSSRLPSSCSSNFEEEKTHIGFRLLIVLIGYLKILIKILSFDRAQAAACAAAAVSPRSSSIFFLIFPPHPSCVALLYLDKREAKS